MGGRGSLLQFYWVNLKAWWKGCRWHVCESTQSSAEDQNSSPSNHIGQPMAASNSSSRGDTCGLFRCLNSCPPALTHLTKNNPYSIAEILIQRIVPCLVHMWTCLHVSASEWLQLGCSERLEALRAGNLLEAQNLSLHSRPRNVKLKGWAQQSLLTTSSDSVTH